MKPNLLKPSNSNTTVLDKVEVEKKQDSKKITQTQNISLKADSTSNNQNEAISKVEKEFKQNKKSLFNAFNADALLSKEKQKYITGQTQNLQTKQSQTDTEEDFEEQNETFVNFNQNTKPKKKEWDFRFKLITVIYILIISVMTGWVTANAARLA